MMPEALEPIIAEIALFNGSVAEHHRAIVRERFVLARMEEALREVVINRFFAKQPAPMPEPHTDDMRRMVEDLKEN